MSDVKGNETGEMISENVEKGRKLLLALVLFGAIGTLQAETYYPTAGGDRERGT